MILNDLLSAVAPLSDPQALWNQQETLYEYYRKGGLAQYVAALPSWAAAFRPSHPAVLCCIDDGIKTVGAVRAAGSLIGVQPEEAREFCRKAGLEKLYSHADCHSAWQLFRAEKGIKEDVRTSEHYLQEFEEFTIARTKSRAAEIGAEYAGHLPLEELGRPAGRHVSRVVYYDGTGCFHPRLLPEEILPGFVISRRFHLPERALGEVAMAIEKQAFDEKIGFGSLFTVEKPLLLIVIGAEEGGEFSARSLAAEAEALLPRYGGRVAVDALIAPMPPA